ncbi:MAG: hypothetical protein SFH39_14630 [Candidatus Magnetobacterium sp. LHC-1]|uniref:Uncharacterized protein n=1 Tax=Candidatus Magnetobacterium casense TaxID=1455061 RepID=A0ABS6RVX4_9BACT|nr:hypothetical protein [Candidatus Magnetobacterium casensis]MBF0607477.1 hypothetical protein [Nitrospirota bacterium]MBV6340597.1 hypothetical protein [Candidatus Magnetobacterium casensis]
MKILLIQKHDLNDTGKVIIDEMKKHAELTTIDMRTDKDYGKIIDSVVSNDKVITW